MNLSEKVKDAERTLKVAAEMSHYYYKKPLIICYSGGKDSDVLLDIAKNCLNPNEFEVLNAHTTVDAPETVYHIREVFAECEAQGIKTEIKLPRDKDGNLISMWSLIVKRGVPTRIQRFCCKDLKETSTPHRMAAMGVRESESVNRRGRDTFGIRERKKELREYRSTAHTFAMFRLDQYGGEDAYQCEIIKACKNNKDTIVNPIYHFNDCDVQEYVAEHNVKMNPLYARGYKRVGCIGCPLGGQKQQRRAFFDYPKYKDNYIKAFDRMLKRRCELGKPTEWKNGEEVFNWWIGENPKQIKIEDIINKGD